MQRVTSASVTVDGVVVGALDCTVGTSGQGLLVLVGVTHEDTATTAGELARKVAGLRILAGERSAVDTGAPVLVVSQFTLYADTSRGRRPTWAAAAPGPVAEPLVAAVVRELRSAGLQVATGVFGAQMAVSSVGDGPVTILLDVAAPGGEVGAPGGAGPSGARRT